MNKKEVYEKKLQNQLDEWGLKIDELEIKAKKTEAEVQQKYEEEIDHLRSKQTEAYEKLSELKQSGDDAWEDLKAGVDSASEAFGTALKSAVSRFQ